MKKNLLLELLETGDKEKHQIVTVTGTQLVGPLIFTIDEDDEE